jgi:hypothetical protein
MLCLKQINLLLSFDYQHLFRIAISTDSKENSPPADHQWRMLY